MDITASDTSNNTSRVAIPLTVTVPFSTNTAPTRSTFFRTDRSPTGIVYDSLRKLVFVSVEVLNEVEVLSSVDGHQIASISTGYPAGIDEAADGSAIYVVSPLIDGVTIIDPDSLQVVGHQSVPKSVSGAQNPVAFFQIAALSNGKVLLNEAFSDFSVPGKTLYFWEPKMGTFSLVGSIGGAPQFWISRSADHSKAISACLALSGFLYDANTDLFTPVSFIGSAVSINSDGSQIASINTQNNSPYITFYDGSFNVTGTLLLAAFWNGGTVPQILFSLDGKHLYIIQDESIGVGVPGGAVTVVDAKNFSLIGLVPAFSFGASIPFTGNVSTSFALDETNMLFGAANGGVGFLDLTSPTALSEPLPQALLLQPTLASLMKPTQSQLTGVGFSQGSALSLYVGAPPSSAQTLKATNVHVQNDNFVNLTIPPGAVPGPSNATFTRSDGFFEILPDAIAFGPTLLSVDPDSGSQAGGDSIKISGFGLDAVNTQVLIGGKPATITQVAPPLALETPVAPIAYLTVKTPPNSAGLADVTVTTSNGSFTLHDAFRYANSVQVYPIAGVLQDILYDSSRKRLYISNEDHNRIEVFDLATNEFLSPIVVGNSPTSIALTPDQQTLAVLNATDGTISVIDLLKMQVTATYPVLTALDLDKQSCGGVAEQISPALSHSMLVSVNCTALLLSGFAHLIDLNTGSLSCVGILDCSQEGTRLILGEDDPVMASDQDGTKVAISRGWSFGVVDLNANTVSAMTWSEWAKQYSVSSTALGDAFSGGFGIHTAQAALSSMMAYEPNLDVGPQSLHNVFGSKLNGSGSLLYSPQDSGVTIFDVHTGRLRLHLAMSDPIPLVMNGMALDETGTKMFLISNTGITIAQLYQVPLSLAEVIPASAAAGTMVTLTGSGFQNGATVTFGTTQVPATYVDSSTLQASVPSLPSAPLRVTINNPDGTQYPLDDAFTTN